MTGLDPQFRAALDELERSGAVPLTRGSAEETRAHYRRLAMARRAEGYVPEAVAATEDGTVEGPRGPVPVRLYTPLEDRGPAVVYLHGGGWVIGDLDTHDAVCRRVSNAVGAMVVSVDYRMAPEHPHPAPVEDAMAAAEWAAARFGERPLGVAGDSAGASLAAGVALLARDRGLPLAAQLLAYPATDPSMSYPSVAENAEGYFLTAADMRWFFGHYLPGGRGAADPVVDLIHADVAGVAPAVVATAQFDPLRDEGAAYAERLALAGVPVTHIPGPGLIHGYFAFLGVVAAADARSAEVLGAFDGLLAGS